MQTFQPNRKGFIKVLLPVSMVLPVMLMVFDTGNVSKSFLLMGLLLLPFAILSWIYLGTYYVLDNGKLRYRSAFIRGEVDVADIRSIVKGATTWVGTRPATATKGLLIKFNNHDDIYVSAQDNDAFITALVSLNDQIKVVESGS